MRGLIITPILFAGLQALNDEQLGQLTRRAIAYVSTGKDTSTKDNAMDALWTVLKGQIDDSEARYEHAKEARSMHARKAAQARYRTQQCTSMHEHARGSKRIPEVPI